MAMHGPGWTSRAIYAINIFLFIVQSNKEIQSEADLFLYRNFHLHCLSQVSVHSFFLHSYLTCFEGVVNSRYLNEKLGALSFFVTASMLKYSRNGVVNENKFYWQIASGSIIL